MPEHTHSWETVGEDDQTLRLIVRCVSCGGYEFYDNVQLQERGMPPGEPPTDFTASLPHDDPVSAALRHGWAFLDMLDKAMRIHPDLSRTFRLYTDADDQLTAIKDELLRAWAKRGFANRVIKEGKPS